MNAVTVTAIYVAVVSVSKALQQDVLGRRAANARVTLAAWTSLAYSNVILFVEAANLVEVAWPLVACPPSSLNSAEAAAQAKVSISWILLFMTACMLMLAGLWLKSSTTSELGFRLCTWERHPEILGYLLVQVILRMHILTWFSALLSSVLIWKATFTLVIKQESSLARKYQEEYLRFWTKSPSLILLLDDTVELMLRLQGHLQGSDSPRNKRSLLKAWPAIYYC